MSKYIIDTKEYGFSVESVILYGRNVLNEQAACATSVLDLEKLNFDYINEHYGQLQDDAYQRGLEEGKRAANDKGCEGCEYSDGVVQENSPCANCCNYYTNNWTKEEFVRGDVVVDEDGTRGIVVSSKNNESNLLYVLFKGYRVPQSVVRKHYKNTGKHYDIDKFLDEIKGDGDK